MVVTPSLFGIPIGSALFTTLEITMFFLVGRRYVDILTDEINYLANGTYPSERALVFSSVIQAHNQKILLGGSFEGNVDLFVLQPFL